MRQERNPTIRFITYTLGYGCVTYTSSTATVYGFAYPMQNNIFQLHDRYFSSKRHEHKTWNKEKFIQNINFILLLISASEIAVFFKDIFVHPITFLQIIAVSRCKIYFELFYVMFKKYYLMSENCDKKRRRTMFKLIRKVKMTLIFFRTFVRYIEYKSESRSFCLLHISTHY